MANTYTVEQAKELYAEAVRLKLLRTENLADAELVAAVCNGIGAAWMPDFMRKLADKLSPAMRFAAAIHDVDYERGGDESDRLAADVIFLGNALLVTDLEYAWYNPMRYIMRARAKRYYEYLRTCGGKAFKAKQEEAKA